jgi:hypothetical protein
MKTLTIREASEAIGRAPATIRRYIKSGRLPAEKEQGKFGEEFKIQPEALQALGIVRGSQLVPRAPRQETLPARSLAEEISQRYVPRELYSELVMKHERLLVQYGMVRAGGRKLLEYRAEAEMKEALLAEREVEIREIRERSEKEIGFLQHHLRQAEIEIEDRNIEINLLQEKVRRLEMATAGASAIRSFDEQVRNFREKEEQLSRLDAARTDTSDARKLDLLQDWLKVCEAERETGDS